MHYLGQAPGFSIRWGIVYSNWCRRWCTLGGGEGAVFSRGQYALSGEGWCQVSSVEQGAVSGSGQGVIHGVVQGLVSVAGQGALSGAVSC